MPLLKKIKENNCEIGIWSISESLDELIQLTNNQNISQLKTKNRQKQFLSTRLLLNKLYPEASIEYNKYGAPEIGGNYFISISHSQDIAAIIISKKKVGIDIEKISEKPLNISSKFISQSARHNHLSKDKATLIWGCKEALFKWHQKGGVNFIEDIQVMPFKCELEGKIIAKFKDYSHTLYYKKIDTYFLVYVCN